jgi:serine/threonine protein kinase
MSFQPEDTIGTYRIVAKLGGGGMGEVFQVEHLVTRRVEALKVLSGQDATPEQRHRFLREIQLQASLSHPNIAGVHNAFWEGERLVMIMELISGRSLANLLQDSRPPLWQSVDYACQALAALEYAHERGVVHRDISPSNMIVTEDRTLKLTDFGLAKSMTNLRLTQSGTLVGSLYYTSPEQVRGCSEVDGRSDLYSLGAVLYEMAAGTKPFCSENPFTLMMAHVEQVPRRPSELDASLPAGLDNILLKALEKDPNKRFESAKQFRHALETLANGLTPAFSTQKKMHPHLAVPAPLALARVPLRMEKPRPARLPRYWQAAAAAALALVSVYAIRAYRPKINATEASGKVSESVELAELPFIWPANLALVPAVKYPTKPGTRTRLKPSAPVPGAPVPSGPEPSAPVPAPTEERTRKKSHFLRAMGRVVHPFHRDSQAAKASDYSSN